VKILEQTDDVVDFTVKGQKGTIEMMGNPVRQGDTLILKKVHIDGPGAGTIGRADLKSMVQAFGKQQGVKKVVIEGAARTTGKMVGKVPRPITVVVE